MTQQQEQPQAVPGVAVLVKNGDRILLVKRANSHGAGTWAPPGGYMQYGETPEQCAIRETREETGVDIDTVKFRVLTNDVFEAEQKHFITIWLEAKYVSGEPAVAAPDELSEVGWFQWADLPQPLFLPLQHLINGETYPSQTTQEKLGAEADTPHPLQY